MAGPSGSHTSYVESLLDSRAPSAAERILKQYLITTGKLKGAQLGELASDIALHGLESSGLSICQLAAAIALLIPVAWVADGGAGTLLRRKAIQARRFSLSKLLECVQSHRRQDVQVLDYLLRSCGPDDPFSSRTPSASSPSHSEDGTKYLPYVPPTNFYVGAAFNLSKGMYAMDSVRALITTLSIYGLIYHVHMGVDLATGRNTGIAYLFFAEEKGLEACVAATCRRAARIHGEAVRVLCKGSGWEGGNATVQFLKRCCKTDYKKLVWSYLQHRQSQRQPERPQVRVPADTTTTATGSLSFSLPLPWSDPPRFPVELKVRMPEPQHVCEALQWLLVTEKGQDPPSLLGVDLETGDLRETQLLQLATGSRAVILRIPALMQPSRGDEAKAAAGLEQLRSIMGDAALLKCGCELRKDALDLLYDTDLRVRMRGGRDITPALRRSSDSAGCVAVMGLVEAFNARHGTMLKKDKRMTCSDWQAQQLSQQQLEYAALDAWMSFRLGTDQALLESRKTCHIDIPEGVLSGALREAGRLLREAQVMRNSCRIPIAHVFEDALWLRRKGVQPRLMVRMAQYDSKMRARDQVEVSFEDIELPWLACATSVHGKTAVLQADQRPRYDAGGTEQLDFQPLFSLDKHPVVKDITRVVTSDFTTELLSRLIMDLVGQPPLAVACSTALCHSRFATKYLLGGAHAIAPASRHLPLNMPRDPSDTVTFDLNVEQGACVDDVVAGNLISLTLGPPGTGKTTCIAAVAYNLAEGSRGASDFPLVVVTTQQNVAALNVLRALLRSGYQNVKLVVGSGYYVEWHEHEYNEAELKYIHVPLPVGRFKLDHVEDSRPQKSWPQLAGERAITIITLGNVATLAKAVGDSSDIVLCKRVGSVLVDEASQAWNGHALILDQAFPNLQRLHLFGDDKQLPPVLSPKDTSSLAAACNLGVRSMYDEARDGGKTHHFLQLQYRMPVKLAAFLSTQLYGGALRSAQGVSSNDTDVVWLPVSSKHAYHTGSHSPYNETEARVVVKLANHIDKLGLKDYGWRHATCLVLTPYSAQRHYIERLCHDASEVRGGRWSIKTVDSFQGREADVVIVSLTKTSCGLGILRDLRRVNVMLSRVRKRLIIVGNRSWLMNTDSLLWRSLATEFLVADSFKELTSILGRRLC